MKQRMKLLVLMIILLGAIGGYLLYAKQPVTPNQIKVSGNIEITTVGLGFKVTGHVAQRFVDEGELVKPGQLIAKLETVDLELETANAHSQLLAAQATLAQLENGSRPQDIAAARAALHSAEADKRNADQEYRRMQQLFSQNAVSAQELDRKQTAAETAVARTEQAAQQLSLILEGPRKEEIELAQARVKQAEQSLKLAQTKLGYAQIASPVQGVVLSKNIEAGEYVSPGTPVVTVGDLDQVWLKAYIAETDLGRVKLGQAVAVTADTYPGKVYEGRIGFIASEAEFTPKNIQTAEERVKLVYRIKIMIPNTEHELKPGMPADAVIHLDGE